MRAVHWLVHCESARFDSQLLPGLKHCRYITASPRERGALVAVDLHVLSLVFLFCKLQCLIIHQTLAFTGDLNVDFFGLGACLHSQVLLNLLFLKDPLLHVCSTFGINLPAGSKVY